MLDKQLLKSWKRGKDKKREGSEALWDNLKSSFLEAGGPVFSALPLFVEPGLSSLKPQFYLLKNGEKSKTCIVRVLRRFSD